MTIKCVKQHSYFLFPGDIVIIDLRHLGAEVSCHLCYPEISLSFYVFLVSVVPNFVSCFCAFVSISFFFSNIGYHRILNTFPCAIQLVLITYQFCIQQCVYAKPKFPIYPSPKHFHFGNHKFCLVIFIFQHFYSHYSAFPLSVFIICKLFHFQSAMSSKLIPFQSYWGGTRPDSSQNQLASHIRSKSSSPS